MATEDNTPLTLEQLAATALSNPNKSIEENILLTKKIASLTQENTDIPPEIEMLMAGILQLEVEETGRIPSLSAFMSKYGLNKISPQSELYEAITSIHNLKKQVFDDIQNIDVESPRESIDLDEEQNIRAQINKYIEKNGRIPSTKEYIDNIITKDNTPPVNLINSIRAEKQQQLNQLTKRYFELSQAIANNDSTRIDHLYNKLNEQKAKLYGIGHKTLVDGNTLKGQDIPFENYQQPGRFTRAIFRIGQFLGLEDQAASLINNMRKYTGLKSITQEVEQELNRVEEIKNAHRGKIITTVLDRIKSGKQDLDHLLTEEEKISMRSSIITEVEALAQTHQELAANTNSFFNDLYNKIKKGISPEEITEACNKANELGETKAQLYQTEAKEITPETFAKIIGNERVTTPKDFAYIMDKLSGKMGFENQQIETLKSNFMKTTTTEQQDGIKQNKNKNADKNTKTEKAVNSFTQSNEQHMLTDSSIRVNPSPSPTPNTKPIAGPSK